VVGVIVNLAVFFGYHVLWPARFSGQFDVLSAVIGIAAGIALIRYKVGVIPVVLVAGLVGIAATFARLLLA
jgi:chromate transporter